MTAQFVNKWKALFQRRGGRSAGDSGPDGITPARIVWLEAAPDVHVSADENGLALLDTRGGRVFTGNPMAGSIWRSASLGLSIDRTAEEIATRFGIPRETVKRDIRVFVEVLERSGLAVRRTGKQ